MHIVTLASAKGGVGKTTLALTLAGYLYKRSRRRSPLSQARLVDADPSQNLSEWSAARSANFPDWALDIAPVGADERAVFRAIEMAKDAGTDWLFIDTPAGTSSIVAKIMKVSDLILIPVLPTMGTLRGTRTTATYARDCGHSSYFVLNRASRSTVKNAECAEALKFSYGLATAPAYLSQRAAISALEDAGLTLSEVAPRTPSIARGQNEVAALFRWMATLAPQ